jgi:glyoxylase-like metal-dependent hydrolase (beta-lactamase superfamily II)
MTMLKPGLRWFDDWYAIEAIAPGFHAIGEPDYEEINWNYLVEGSEGALLFDTGPGVRDIGPVVASLTAKPLIVMPSHLHYDHVGNLHRFADLAMADLPILRSCVRDELLYATDDLYLRYRTNSDWKPVRIDKWWPIGHVIDLGGVKLEIIHTPGHSPDSISLFDARRNILLASDFLYEGSLYGQQWGASLPDYLATAQSLQRRLNAQTAIFGAHGQADEEGRHGAPRLGYSDLSDLVTALGEVRDGEKPLVGADPDSYVINARMSLLVSPEAYGDWR